VVPDPIRGAPHLLVMCEVLSPNGEPHPTNTRAQLAALMNDKVCADRRAICGCGLCCIGQSMCQF
jgi:glutamine synthetase